MPPLSRPATRIVQLARRQELELRRGIGGDVRRAREDAGISLRKLAAAAGISPAELSAIENGAVSPSLEVLVRISRALGGRLTVRLDPGTGPIIRDHIQAAMLEGLIATLHRRWRKLLDVSIYRPVRGAIDLVLDDPLEPVTLAAEAQSQLRRLEQQIRWAGMKADALAEGGARELGPLRGGITNVSRLLVLRVTSKNLEVVRSYAHVMATAYPARQADAVAALTGTRRWPGPALIWMDVSGGMGQLRTAPPRGIALGR